MHGNVWEWCEDVWRENYKDAPQDGSAWTEDEEHDRRVVRGGSWGNDVYLCRSAFRSDPGTDNRYNIIGLRVVVSARTL